MISVAEALERVLDSVRPVTTERVGLLEASGRVLAEDAISERDIPGYANSAMDGFAVRHEDLIGNRRSLRIVGTAAAGATSLPLVKAGEAARIMTGGALPEGADTVVRVEDTETDGDSVEIRALPSPGANIRHPGEDVRRGDRVLRGGRVLSPADIGVLGSIGRAMVTVHAKPRAAIVSTGNELIEADEAMRPGLVVNSNAYTLASAIRESGGVPTILPIARDRPEEIRSVLEDAGRSDVVLSTGGVSVGDFDFVKEALDQIGVERLFWKVAQKPGKPITFGRLAGVPWFGLPGNPVSSLVCFYLYVRPALRRMAGANDVHLPTTRAIVAEDMPVSKQLTELVRVRLEPRGREIAAFPTGTQSSGALRSMSLADGLAIAPVGLEKLVEGSEVKVLVLDPCRSSAVAPFGEE